MYSSLKRQCSHLSPIMSGDGASSVPSPSSTPSSSSSTPTYIPPPPSAVVSSSNSVEDGLDRYEEPNWRVPQEMVNWRKARIVTTKPLQGPTMPSSKFRKIIDQEYAPIQKTNRLVRFQDEKENGLYSSSSTLNTFRVDSSCNETASSFWSEGGGTSFGFSKYIHPPRPFLPKPPPPSPNSKMQQRQGPSFPRTNPYATLPRQFSSHYPTKGSNIWPLSGESSSSTATSATPCTTSSSESGTEGAWTRYDRRFRDAKSIFSSSIENAQRRRILAGLKSFGIKGELLISILLNRGLITVTIDEGRNLQSPCVSGCCSTYVRISLMPDEEKRTQCKTELIPYSNRPVFHQTFTVELLPEDYEKRLVISMWHRENAKEKSMLLGCMAFTIRHMVESNKLIDGWYFLLAPEYGRKKHLAVHKVNMMTYYGPVDTESERRQSHKPNASIRL